MIQNHEKNMRFFNLEAQLMKMLPSHKIKSEIDFKL